jgi:hypothetical protein
LDLLEYEIKYNTIQYHMEEYEITHFSMYGYELAATSCQNKYKKGGVCILAKKI